METIKKIIMNISFIIPSRNNLKYLKWSYQSIRKNLHHGHQVCVADDFSNDGTWDWCKEMMAKDSNFIAIKNHGPTRLGHTILYDRLINEVATNDVCIIWHADMYATPGIDKEIEKLIKPKTIVSITRIEPPLHPPGPEKVLQDFGTEPEEFKEEGLLNFVDGLVGKDKQLKYSKGIFAPWAFYKKDFQEIGGHDEGFYPQSKEDSDIFNRFALNGVEFIQTWNAYVYHMTCRGSRFNPTLTTPGKNSPEWEEHNLRSTRNFIRKWGTMVRHDAELHPIIPHKYNIAFVVRNCTAQGLAILEPHCDRIHVDCIQIIVDDYITTEQENTKFNLKERVFRTNTPAVADIVIEFDFRQFTQQQYYFIDNISAILDQVTELGDFEFDIFKVRVNALKTYEHSLINVNNTGWRRKNMK